MGRLPSNNRTYEIKALQERHREILRRLTLGQQPKDIARELHCTTAVVTYTKNSILGHTEITKLQNGRNQTTMQVANQIKAVAPEALKVVEKVIKNALNTDDPTSLQVNAAKDILDRAGHTPVRRFAGIVAARRIPTDVMNEFKDNARRAGIMVEDAEYEDVTPKSGDENANT